MDASNKRRSNRLINETSPYLLQHAHNPVDWFPWGEDALEKAESENKLLLISIGYSACHWCHVMERESFEDEEVAALMNAGFVCIKVDREERPDIDAVYMDAVQYITGRGGWPLNCFALPDGRPVYGGTYFRKNDWMQLLVRLAALHRESNEKLLEYSEQLLSGLNENNDENNISEKISLVTIENASAKWKSLFDAGNGGINGAPKFPMPNGLEFLIQCYYVLKDNELLAHLGFTLDKMASGGIYDQIGGGFARYTVDAEWKVPHFEKMLYDNAQLIGVYSLAYRLLKKESYRQVIMQTLSFLDREMLSPDGGYYSAIDADSEGNEGKYYTWTYDEINYFLGEDGPLFCSCFNVTPTGNWEHGQNILYTVSDRKKIAAQFSIDISDLEVKIDASKKRLLNARYKRIRPATDTKVLCAWNALCLSGFVEAYKALGDDEVFHRALKLANYLLENYTTSDDLVYRMRKNHAPHISGFLDDYAFLAKAFLDMYTVSFDEKWLIKSKELTDYVLANFNKDNSGLFNLTSVHHEQLFKNKTEVTDHVIPASNSVLANVLFNLSVYFEVGTYREKSLKMLEQVNDKFNAYPAYFSNWGQLALKFSVDFPEVIFTGAEALKLQKQFNLNFHLAFLAGSANPSDLPLLKERVKPTKSLIYVCRNKTCQLPVDNVEMAIDLLNK